MKFELPNWLQFFELFEMKKGEHFGEAGMEEVGAWCNFTLRRCQEVKRIIKGFFEFRQNSHTNLPMLEIDVIRQT